MTTVADAVARLVHDGDYLAIGGFGCDRIPTAVVHEILRQGKQNLRFAGHTATHDFQILCAGNLTGRGQTLAAVDIAYVVGLEARGLSPHARRVMESGEVACTEWTQLRAGRALQGRRDGRAVPAGAVACSAPTPSATAPPASIACPFTGETLVAVPALYPDVAAIHVHEADRYGNCRIRGTTVADLDLARAAQAAHHHLRAARSPTTRSAATRPDRHPVLLRRRGVRGAVRQLSGQHALRILLRRGPPAPGWRPSATRRLPGVPRRVRVRGAGLRRVPGTCGGLRRMQELRQQELLLDRGR